MNWKNGIDHLIACGMTIKGIATAIDLADSSVYDIRNGNTLEPRGMAAVRLHELFDRYGYAITATTEKEA